MPIEYTAENFSEQLNHCVMSMTIKDKLNVEDYDSFVPELERFTEKHEDVRLIVRLDEFTGWAAGARWEDSRFGDRVFNGVKRVAFVGQESWKEGTKDFAKAFSGASIRYFSDDHMEDALKWATGHLEG